MIIDLIKAVLLGIVEGLTEFLPVSSTGHLIIANEWLSFSESFTFMFDIVIQLGAILAVILYFRRQLNPFKTNAKPDPETLRLWSKVLLAVLPALVIGYLSADWVENNLFNPQSVAVALIIGGFALWWIELRRPASRFAHVRDLTYKTALWIGIFQCLAIIPGTSRSAATIIGALLLGASRQTAAKFSFYLAIPTIFAASIYSLMTHPVTLSAAEWGILAAGFLSAFLSALMVIGLFLKYIQTKGFKIFAYYRIVLGVSLVLLTLAGLIG